jgi:FkbM family methyltransferase
MKRSGDWFVTDSELRKARQALEQPKNNITWEGDFIDDLINLSKTKEVALDIGANFGFCTYKFSNFFKQVIGFEPVKEVYDCLVENIDKDNCILHNYALGNKSDLVLMLNQRKRQGQNQIIDNVVAKEMPSKKSKGSKFEIIENVQVKPLDELNLQNISMIKIDVEGFEGNVIEGAKETIRRNKPIMGIEKTSIDSLFTKREVNIDKQMEELGYFHYKTYGKHSTNNIYLPKEYA